MSGRYVQIGFHPETMAPIFVWLPDDKIVHMLDQTSSLPPGINLTDALPEKTKPLEDNG